MKHCTSLLIALVIFTACRAQKITLEDIWVNYKFYPKTYDAEWLSDSSFVLFDKGTLCAENIHTGIQDTLIRPGELSDSLEIEGFISKQHHLVLLEGPKEQIYRHSYAAHIYLFNLHNKSCLSLSPQKIRYPLLHHQAGKVAFVENNNLKVYDLATGNTLSITGDSLPGSIINGASDWVYEEEFAITRAFCFSADGGTLYYLKFDEREVPQYELQYWEEATYPRTERYKYPVAGEKNAKVSVWKYDFATAQNTCLLHPDSLQTEFYVPRLFATGRTGEAGIFTLNRRQNSLHLITFGAMGGADTLWKDTSNTYLEIEGEPIFVDEGSRFIYVSEQTGFRRVFIKSRTGDEMKYLSPEGIEADMPAGIDTVRKEIFYTMAHPTPMNRCLMACNYSTGSARTLQGAPGVHKAMFNPSGTYCLHSHSSATQPPIYSLVRTGDGEVVDTKEKNGKLVKLNKELQPVVKEFLTINTAEGKLLNAWMIKPRNFNPRKKYPVLMYVYGGPGYQTVKNEWDGFNFYWYQLLADKGFIILSVDPTGSGGRGKNFRDEGYPVLGQKETEDLIAVAKYLGAQTYVDKNRIGIWGWSYGGYMSLLCLTAGADYFKAGIAVAPVSSWRFYDTIYTERYMKMPSENPEGYGQQSPLSMAHLLKGQLLLVHGTGDDNVHVRHSLAMQQELIKNNKQFRSFYYPDKNHGIYGGNTRLHLYQMMTAFLEENLKK